MGTSAAIPDAPWYAERELSPATQWHAYIWQCDVTRAMFEIYSFLSEVDDIADESTAATFPFRER